MASKIKVRIKSDDTNINLPSIGFGVAMTFVRFGLWSTKFVKNMDQETRQLLEENKPLIIEQIRFIFKELKKSEPFTLVEIKSSDAYVLIEIK